MWVCSSKLWCWHIARVDRAHDTVKSKCGWWGWCGQSSKSKLFGSALRVSGSVYKVSASYPAGLRKLHVCVDMIRSPDCASVFKLLCWHLRVPFFFFAGPFFFASYAEVPLVLGAFLPLGGGWAADVCTHGELKTNFGSQVLLHVENTAISKLSRRPAHY